MTDIPPSTYFLPEFHRYNKSALHMLDHEVPLLQTIGESLPTQHSLMLQGKKKWNRYLLPIGKLWIITLHLENFDVYYSKRTTLHKEMRKARFVRALKTKSLNQLKEVALKLFIISFFKNTNGIGTNLLQHFKLGLFQIRIWCENYINDRSKSSCNKQSRVTFYYQGWAILSRTNSLICSH